MHWGNLETRCVCMTRVLRKKMKMVAKGISQDDFPNNGVGRQSNRSLWMRTMTVSGSSPTHSPLRVVPYFTDTFGSVNLKNNKFCFEE